jgi:hypothetical protein
MQAMTTGKKTLSCMVCSFVCIASLPFSIPAFVVFSELLTAKFGSARLSPPRRLAYVLFIGDKSERVHHSEPMVNTMKDGNNPDQCEHPKGCPEPGFIIWFLILCLCSLNS